jgi:hypothetical protein
MRASQGDLDIGLRGIIGAKSQPASIACIDALHQLS